MTKIVMSRTSVRHAALFVLVIACLLSPLGVVLRGLHAEGEKNVPVAAPDVESDKVAAIAAEFRVDESGAATYTIPIYAVPGTAGVAPNLSLNYSSQGGYGPLGKGWSIGGLSSVTRCRATREAGDFITGSTPTDGTPKPINFSADDRFCLDGQRLVAPLADQVTGGCATVAGFKIQELRTEVESFQRVCAYKFMPDVSRSSPYFFTVERKDGSISWYGDRASYSSDSRPDGYVEANAAGFENEALLWAQTRFQDSTGNYIDYRYHENPGSPAASVEHLLAEVQFTGKTVLAGQTGSALAPYAKVMFNYAMRPEAQWSKGYASGGTFVQRWRLANIMSCITAAPNLCSTANQARFYELGYGTSVSGSGLEVLTSVQECRDSGKTVCAMPTAFTWSAGKYEFATKEYPPNLPTGSLSKFRGYKLGDVDGDGRLDIVYLKDQVCSTEGIFVLYGIVGAGGTPSFTQSASICSPSELNSYGEGSWQLFDYDGDGRDDLFARGSSSWVVYRSQGRAGNGNFIPTNLLPPNVVIPAVNGKDDQPRLVDINGDGLMDVVYPSGGSLRGRLMERQATGFGWGAERAVAIDMASLPPFPSDCIGPLVDCWYETSSAATSKAGFVQLADFNGDAASDLLIQVDLHFMREERGNCIPKSMGASPTSGGDAGGGPGPKLAVLHHALEEETAQKGGVAAVGPCQTIHSVTSTLHAFTVKDITASTISVASYSPIITGKPSSISLADANGDGLTDVFYLFQSSNHWAYRINSGVGMLPQQTAVQPADFKDFVRFVDVNGDGRADVLVPFNAGPYKAYRVKYALPGGGYGAETSLPGVPGSNGNALLCEGSGCDQNKKAPMFADFDGDGNLDFISLKYDDNADLFLSRSGSRFSPRDVVTRITNGFGANTDIYYAPLTNNALYRRDSGTRNSANWGRGAPVTDLLMPMYAVAAVSSSSPQEGNPNAMATVYYRYAGAKMQAGGRGFLGFREIVTYDPNQVANQHVVTGTLYHQNFPYVGMPLETTKRVVTSAYVVPACLAAAPTESCFSTPGQAFPALAGTVFAKSTQVWEADRDIGAGVAGYAAGVQTPVHVRTAGTEEEVRDPFNGGGITSKVATTFAYGAYGNVTATDVRTYDGAGALLYTVTTANEYVEDNSAKWRLGRLTQSTVTHARPGVPSIQRKSAFKYAMSGAATGLLEVERSGYTGSDGSGLADQNLLKTYALDAYGNRLAARVCANSSGFPTVSDCNASLTQFRPANARTVHRYSRTVYDALGRYPTETWEPFWNGTAAVERKTATIHARNPFGDVTHASDVNGVQSKALYGSLGRAYYAWQQTTVGGVETDAATGVRSITRYRWCGAGAGQVTCPTGAKFRQETLTTEAPGQWTYFDVLGRPVLQATQTFNVGVSGKDASAVCTTYDTAGKPRRVSSPFFLPGTVGASGPTIAATACTDAARLWATTSYDVLGRPVAASAPDEAGSGGFATVTTSYNGLATTVTDPRGKATTSLNWATGELRRVTDANGVQINYAYRADGSVLNVDRDAGRGTVRNAFVYDALGRKIQQTDPDSGVTTFEYNALGELTAQLDSAGNRIETWYDARGRVWRKVVKRADGMTESEALYTFDTAANGVGKQASESITGTYDGWVGQSGMALAFSRSYSYDTLGRPYGVTTVIDGTSYPAAVRYDARGRIWKQQDASGRWALNHYTTLGHLRAICDTTEASTATGCAGATIATDPNARTAVIFMEADARGNMILERRAQSIDMEVRREYWARSGRLAGICAGNASTCGIMDEGYGWDAAGNLSTTQKETRYLEVYTYDNLNRLTLANATMINGVTANQPTFNATYDVLGNICAVYGTSFIQEGRSGCGTSGIPGSGGTGTTGPHRVRQNTNASNVVSDFYYDIRGNQTVRTTSAGPANTRIIKYSLDDKAYEISLGGTVRTRFWYGADGQRYKRQHDGKKTLYLGNVEIEVFAGVTTVKRNVGGVLQQSIVGSTVTSHYLFHDQLGSVVRTTNATGTIVDNLDYRHFGYRRSFTNPATTTESFSGVTSRGFTGHEHVDGTGINVVHMNGRIYDPQLHRFLQADPIIQSPANLQSWNAYTYVFNNPLAYTDPTGMMSWRQVLGIVIAVVGTYVTAGMDGGFFAKLGTAMAFGAASGYVSTGTMQGALWGAVSAAAFYSIGSYFEGAKWAQAAEDSSGVFGSGLNAAGYGTKVLAHGATGGVMSKLQGGKFGHGFASAGVTEAFAPAIAKAKNPAASVAVASIVGGTASKLSGGKFANGATTAAFSYAFNQIMHQGENTGRRYGGSGVERERYQGSLVEINLPGVGDTYVDVDFLINLQDFRGYAREGGVELQFNNVYRTEAEHQRLLRNYLDGRPGFAHRPVENSLHRAGLAVDIQFRTRTVAEQRIILSAARRAGLSWGGTFNDPPHFYIDPGTSRSVLIRNATVRYNLYNGLP